MTRHLLLLGLDGLRTDRAFGTGLAPTLDALAARGSMQPAMVEGPTISGPSWASILTGAAHTEHRVMDNLFLDHRIAPDGDLLSRAWQRDPTTKTLSVTSWHGLAHPDGPGPIISTRPLQIATGTHRVVLVDTDAERDTAVDTEALERALGEFARDVPDVAFVYFVDCDHAGHMHGGLSPEYDAAVQTIDANVRRMVDVVEHRARTTDEEWIVAITTDHGHTDAGGHGGASELERRSFLLVVTYGAEPIEVPEGIRPVEFAQFLLDARAGE